MTKTRHQLRSEPKERPQRRSTREAVLPASRSAVPRRASAPMRLLRSASPRTIRRQSRIYEREKEKTNQESDDNASASSSSSSPPPSTRPEATTNDHSTENKQSTNGHLPNKNAKESPIKEIVFQRDDGNEIPPSPARKKKKLRRAPDDLDETTMQRLKTYLTDTKYLPRTILDDDEVNNFMVRVGKAAERQAEYHTHLLGESDASDASLYAEILADETEYAVGHEFFKEVSAALKEESSDFEPDLRTMSWVKRAAGLHRSSAELQMRESSLAEADAKSAMKTRTSTRKARVEKREKGIKELVAALDEIEEESGPFVPRKRKPKKKAIASPVTPPPKSAPSPYEADDDEPPKAVKRLKATIRKRRVSDVGPMETSNDIVVSRIVVNGRPLRALESGRLDRNGQRQKRKYTRSKDRGPKEDTPNLRLIDWERRRKYGRSLPYEMADPSFRKHINEQLPESFSPAGIVCRLPRWSALPFDPQLRDPPRLRHSNATYANLCQTLLTALSGPARSWAKHEFFYNDLDRAWYTRNTFLEAVAKLGIGPETRLNRRQWAAVRRRIPNKPRLFSKKFIKAELRKRDEYRATIRSLQRNGHAVAELDSTFQYDVPAVVSIGAQVTAYSQKFRILHRGVVKDYDEPSASYLIDFGSKPFGMEYCPDTEVATHGGPRILLSVQPRTVAAHQPLNKDGLPCGCAKQISQSLYQDKLVRPDQELANSLYFTPVSATRTNGQARGVQSQKELVAEHEMLLVVLSTVDVASRRKELLLAALEEASARLESLPSTNASFLKESIVWLWANLEHTNEVLEEAIQKMRLLYGKAYLPRTSTDRLIQKNFVETTLKTKLGDQEISGRAGAKWSRVLASRSQTLGALVAPEIYTENVKPQEMQNLCPRQQARLCSSAKLLFSGSFCQLSTFGMGPGAAGAATYFPTSVGQVLALPEMPPTMQEGEDLYMEVKAARTAAVSDLEEALGMLHTELGIAGILRRLPSPEH